MVQGGSLGQAALSQEGDHVRLGREETAAASLEAAAADGSAAAVPPMTMFELPYESYPVETKVWTKEDFVELGYDASEIEVQPVYVESFLDEYPEGELV